MNRVLNQIGAWTDNRKSQGCTVAILDSGIVYHPDIKNRILLYRDFVKEEAYPTDVYGHGTHIAGIIGGNGSLSHGLFRGIAPNTTFVVGKVLDEKGDGTAAHMLQALEWIREWKDKYEIRIINISLGVGKDICPVRIERIQKELNALWDEGMLIVSSAGNNGPDNNSLSALGESEKCICVGCHDGEYFRNHPGRCFLYSGRGDSSLLRGPDLVAPGTEIVSCNAKYLVDKRQAPYCKKSGTSMATAIVSGCLSAVWGIYPQRTNQEIKEALRKASVDLGLQPNAQGAGMISYKNLFEFFS